MEPGAAAGKHRGPTNFDVTHRHGVCGERPILRIPQSTFHPRFNTRVTLAMTTLDHNSIDVDGPDWCLRNVVLPVLGVGLLWASWPTLREIAGRWTQDPRYSHGFLVPAFAAFLLWQRRGQLAAQAPGPSGWGLLLIAVGAALKLVGTRYYVVWFEALALLPSLAGVSLLIGGWPALRWAAPAIAFLFFMIPLPYRVEHALGYPLQRLATLTSNFALQTMGLPAVAEGHVILLGDSRIGVVEACNGLGMLFMFFAFAVGVALVLQRSLADKVLIILSAVPIALAANIARITVTGLLHETVGGRVADAVYHDLAGWLMMPLALAAFGAELWLLDHLFVEVAPDRPLPIGFLPGEGIASPLDREARGQRPNRSAQVKN